MPRYLTRTLALCCLELVDVVGVAVLVVALPTIAQEFHASNGAIALAAGIYALAYGSLLPSMGRCSDVWGHRRFVLLGAACLAIASLLGATATSIQVVVAARAAQGVGAALAIPGALALVMNSATSTDERRQGLALWTATGALGGATGFAFGGLLTDLFGWRSAFVAIAGVSLVLIGVLLRVMPRSTPRPDRQRLPDVVSAVGMPVALGAIIAGVTYLDAGWWPIAMLVGGALLGGWLIHRQRVVRHPLVPTTLLDDRTFQRGIHATATITLITSGTATLVSFWFQQARGLSTFSAGCRLLGFSAGVVIGSWLGNRLIGRIGTMMSAVAGFVAIACALIVMITAVWLAQVGIATVGLIVMGVGLGCASVSTNELALGEIASEVRGVASGLLSAAAPIGTAFGIALTMQIVIAISKDGVHSHLAMIVGLCAQLLPLAWIIARLRRNPTF